jgi:hypothetical protein
VQYKRLAAAYTYGYNLSQFARQAQQLGLALKELASRNRAATIYVSGRGDQSAMAAAAIFVAEQLSTSQGSQSQFILKLSSTDFRFAAAKSIRDASFLPGAVKYWDLPGLVACLSQQPDLPQGDKDEDFVRLNKLRGLQ